MEIEREVLTFHVDQQCDVCKTGIMAPNPFNEVMLGWQNAGYTGEPTYPHTCNNAECGAKATFKERYPKLTYKWSTDSSKT